MTVENIKRYSNAQRVTTNDNAIDKDISRNFSFAKVVAIYTVVLGHWFSGTILWIPVTVGLFIFAFSSAYFTAIKYPDNMDLGYFWIQKLKRLGISLIVILIFLSCLLISKGSVVYHWHTVVHFFGLSGFLNWFSIPNQSALGNGLWFLTLLLIFYIIYPLLSRLNNIPILSELFAIAAVLSAIFLESTVKVGHELWITSLAFILGVFYAKRSVTVSDKSLVFLIITACALLLALNILAQVKQLNALLILLTCLSVALFLIRGKIPETRIMMRIVKLEKNILEVFILHTYLFLDIFQNKLIDLILSLIVIFYVSKALCFISSMILSYIKRHSHQLSLQT